MSYQYTQKAAEDIYLYHLFLYYEKGCPMLSDYEFDQLQNQFQKMFPDSKIFNKENGTLTTSSYRDRVVKFEKRYLKFQK